MSTNATHGNESIDPRTERALTECMSVLPEGGDVYTVVGENGGTYRVDGREQRCTCPDHRHRDVRCKHIRRVAVATGAEPVPADVDGVDPQLGEHTDTAPQVVATDGAGGIIDASADDGAEILDDGGPEWVGPFTEFDRYGEPTGARFVRCPECGVEVLDDERATASHRPACRFD